MPIQFRCLNCGQAASADDDEAGDFGECTKCGVTYKVPQPIGGKLTEKRIVSRFPARKPSTAGKMKSASNQPESAPDSDDTDLAPNRVRYFDPQNVPQYGFDIQVKIENEVYGRDERLWVEDSAESIRHALLDHLEAFPQYFDRGFLLLNVHRWSIKPDSYDLNIRLVGLLNGEEFSKYFYASPTSAEQRSLVRGGGLIALPVMLVAGLFGGLVGLLTSSLWGNPIIRSHQRLRKKAARDLTLLLDAEVGRPQSMWNRFRRFLDSNR